MRTLRRLALVAVIAAGAGMIGSSVSGVASLDAKLESVTPARSVQTEDVLLKKKRCEERRQRLLEQQRRQRRDQTTSYET